MNYCNSCIYYTHNYFIDKYYCVAHKIALIVTPSEHKPAFCTGHSEKKEEKEMSDEIKLEVGQIWDSNSGIVREILYIGKEKVFYRILHHQVYQRVNDYESSTTIEDFKENYGKKLLLCWPPKPEITELTCGFHSVISVDKEGNIVLSKSTWDNLIAAYKSVVGVKD